VEKRVFRDHVESVDTKENKETPVHLDVPDRKDVKDPLADQDRKDHKVTQDYPVRLDQPDLSDDQV